MNLAMLEEIDRLRIRLSERADDDCPVLPEEAHYIAEVLRVVADELVTAYVRMREERELQQVARAYSSRALRILSARPANWEFRLLTVLRFLARACRKGIPVPQNADPPGANGPSRRFVPYSQAQKGDHSDDG